jgi:DNA-binding transcriptional ArsR family regulator
VARPVLSVCVSPKPLTQIDDPRYVKALAHPMRIRILAILKEEQRSPVQLADQLGASLGSVAYHVRKLHTLGLLELVGTRQRRGATEHTYRAREHPRFSDEAWEALSPIAKQRMLSAMLQQIGEYASGSAAVGGFDRPDAHITRTALDLDERAWTRLAEATKRWLREVDRIEAGARQRREKKAPHDEETLSVGLVIMLFEALPFSRRGAGGDERPRGQRRASRAPASRRS